VEDKLASIITVLAGRRAPRPDPRVAVERRGDEDKTFTSDDKLDRELFDLLRSMAIDATQKKKRKCM